MSYVDFFHEASILQDGKIGPDQYLKAPHSSKIDNIYPRKV